MVKKLAIRSLGRGIGSMDYIDTLLNGDDERLGEFRQRSNENLSSPDINLRPDMSPSHSGSQDPNTMPDPIPTSARDWCKYMWNV